MTTHARRPDLMDRIDPWGERAARLLLLCVAITFGGGTVVQVLPSAVVVALLGLAALGWVLWRWLGEDAIQEEEEGDHA